MFGDRMKDIRKKANMTQEKLEEKTGIKKGVLSVYESNKSKPGLEAIEKICLALEVSADYLIFGKIIENEQAEGNQLNAEGQKMLDEYIEYLKSKYPIENGKEYDKEGNLWYPGDGEKIS